MSMVAESDFPGKIMGNIFFISAPKRSLFSSCLAGKHRDTFPLRVFILAVITAHISEGLRQIPSREGVRCIKNVGALKPIASLRASPIDQCNID